MGKMSDIDIEMTEKSKPGYTVHPYSKGMRLEEYSRTYPVRFRLGDSVQYQFDFGEDDSACISHDSVDEGSE